MTSPTASVARVEASTAPLLRLRGLTKTYRQPHLWREDRPIHALENINLEIPAASTFALVGESGSGKSTLAMCVAQLEVPDAGEVWFKQKQLTGLSSDELRHQRAKIQLIFQSSALALNPRFTTIETVTEPLEIQGSAERSQQREIALECMRLTGLTPELAQQPILTLSGGQRQRLAIARALTLSPELLIFDESFSGLDLIVQAQILRLLASLQKSRSLTYLLITHDLSLVIGFASHLAVMQSGRIVESGAVSEVLAHPQHAHTQALIAAMPKWPAMQAAESGA